MNEPIKLLLVVGTRPNYIKITQFKKVASKRFADVFDIKIVHTGQHFDKAMADDFFKQLDILPDYMLNIPKGTANNQIGEIIIRLEKVVHEFKPNLIMVPGDVNTTLAAAITANKMNVPLAHLEAGLRSNDRTMPEEINRILVDDITDLFFVTENSGLNNLLSENKPEKSIFLVGNTMIDTLVHFEKEINDQHTIEKHNLEKNGYILMTIHRPATVDNKDGLLKLIKLLTSLNEGNKVVFPMHPRTLNNFKKYNLENQLNTLNNIQIIQPLDYFNFQNLIKNSKMVITDSGGVQEETTFLQKPCITLRPNTERPVTTEIGSNTLMEFNVEKIMETVDRINSNNYKQGEVPKLWDGKSTERILAILKEQKALIK